VRKLISSLIAFLLVAGTVAIISAAATASGVQKGPVLNPDAGLSDAQRLARHAANSAAWDTTYRAWLDSFVKRGADPRSLPRANMLTIAEGPAPDLPSAVRQADLIVVGRALAIRFEPGPRAYVRFAVDRTLKGSASGIVDVMQLGGPEPLPDVNHAILAVADNAPLLLPGDRAVLFLRRPLLPPYAPSTAGPYYVESFTGTYLLNNGWVRALDGNPFHGQADAQTVETFTSILNGLPK
jgi:hypothetical protein